MKARYQIVDTYTKELIANLAEISSPDSMLVLQVPRSTLGITVGYLQRTVDALANLNSHVDTSRIIIVGSEIDVIEVAGEAATMMRLSSQI